MVASKPSQRAWFQFGLGSLLFFTFCVAGFLGGYRGGWQAGQEAKDRSSRTMTIYAVNNILETSGDSQCGAMLVRYIKHSIAPGTWDPGSNANSIQFDSTKGAIIVAGTRDVHHQVSDFLDQCCRLQDQGDASDLDSI